MAMVIRPQDVADFLHAVIAADRDVYAQVIVHRLQNEDGKLKASANWREEHCLPVPAQMLRLGAEAVQTKGTEFSYALRSLSPINPANAPQTALEQTGLEAVAANSATNYYGEELLGGRRYFTAVYPDTANHAVCTECHSRPAGGSKRECKLGDVLGALVVRVPLEF